MSRPDTISRATDSATSTVTSTARTRCFRPVPPWFPSRKALNPDRPTRSAGSKPKPSVVSTVESAATVRIRRSTAGRVASGSVGGTRLENRGTVTTATSRPSTPPRDVSTMLCVTICRTSRARPAPSATRTANSRSCAAARARSRFARLAHIRSSRQMLAPASVTSISRKRGAMLSRIRKTLTPVSSFVSG